MPQSSEAEFAPGQRVKVINGPFAFFFGSVEQVYAERRKLKVEVNVFERIIPVEMEFRQVEKVEV